MIKDEVDREMQSAEGRTDHFAKTLTIRLRLERQPGKTGFTTDWKQRYDNQPTLRLIILQRCLARKSTELCTSDLSLQLLTLGQHPRPALSHLNLLTLPHP